MYKDDIEIIRIIPMSVDEESFRGMSHLEAQQFFTTALVNNNYMYHFGRSGLKEDSGALLLFQYNKAIIASAILEEVITYPNIYNGTKGSYKIKEGSIHIFEPIILEEFKFLNHKIKRYGQAKQRFFAIDFDMKQFLNRIKNV